MSVLRIPVRVAKTLIAPTVTVLTAVLVNKDSLKTEQIVKVERLFCLRRSQLEVANKLSFANETKTYFCSSEIQMSMNVLRIPVRVMKTLIVPIVMVLRVVLVNKDLLELEPFVNVLINYVRYSKPGHY